MFLIYCVCCYPQIIFDFEKSAGGWESCAENQEITWSGEYAFSGSGSLKISLGKGETAWIRYPRKISFNGCRFLKFNIYMPDGNLPEVSFKCYIKDSEWNWFETGLFTIGGGEEKEIALDISFTSLQWKPVAHLKSWDSYTANQVSEFGLILFFPDKYTGSFYMDSFELIKERYPDENIYLYNFEAGPDNLKQFEKFEITFNTSQLPSNPFDSEELKITGRFTSPSGTEAEIPAFYYHDYLRHLDNEGENLTPYGSEKWKIRFAPQEEGLYEYSLNVYQNGNKTFCFEGGGFFVEKAEKKGFIRWDASDPFYMAFQNGEFFYPIGHTLRSPDDIRNPYRYEFVPPSNMGTFAYDRYFKKMHENGENYARIWMSAWWSGIEWNPYYAPHYKGLGRYSVENAWRLDYILDAADKYNIYIDLTLINHGQFGRPDAEWLDNPYNVINGGMLKTADEFFTNPSAIDYFKKRLDYITARWGHSTSIVFWELWNEVDLTLNYNTQNVKTWHEKMHPYLRSIDPYNHLITTHYCRKNADPAIWAIPEIEMIAGNSYSDEMVKSVLEFFTKRKPFEKPMFINEYGRGRNRKQLENNLHCGIWASSMVPLTGAALFWWWPFIDHFDLYFHYKALSEFWKGEDRRGMDFQLTDAKVESEGKDMGIIGIQNNFRGFFWIYAEKVFNKGRPTDTLADKKPCTVTLNNFEPGNYIVEIWDTYKGIIIGSEELTLAETNQQITVDKVLNDIALKIKKGRNGKD